MLRKKNTSKPTKLKIASSTNSTFDIDCRTISYA